MTLYYLGKFLSEPDKQSDCYVILKRTGSFLMIKQSSRAKFTYRLKKKQDPYFKQLAFEPEITEAEYKDINRTFEFLLPLKVFSIKQIVEIIASSKLFNYITEIDSSKTISSKSTDSFSYKLDDGTVLKGTLESIIEICKRLGKPVDIEKIEGIDRSKFYYSTSKKEWLEISKMATPHIMNSVIKNIRDYYDVFKVDGDCSIPDFFDKLQKWTDDKVLVTLTQELNKRATN